MAQDSAPIPQKRTLNLGSGRKQKHEAVNVDVVPDTNPDLVVDLNVAPWPLPSNHFEKVFANDVIEHLDNVVSVLQEVHRVCRNGALVHITVPHYSCCNAFTDPTHRHYFGCSSFHYFTRENDLPFYTRTRFRRLSTQLVFFPSLVNKVVWRLANRYPSAYERRWAWIFPAWFLSFELEVVKDESLASNDG